MIVEIPYRESQGYDLSSFDVSAGREPARSAVRFPACSLQIFCPDAGSDSFARSIDALFEKTSWSEVYAYRIPETVHGQVRIVRVFKVGIIAVIFRIEKCYKKVIVT